MKKRQGSIAAALVAVLVLILLAASAYLGIAAFAARSAAQGELFLRNGEFASALISFKNAERFDSYVLRKSPRVIEGIAESYFGLDDSALSTEYYLRVVAADPGNAKAVYRLGMIYLKEKNYDKTEEQIKTLQNMRTYEAKEYAEELSELLRENSVKGVLRDLYDRFAPNIPGLPGMSDRFDTFRDRLTPDTDIEKEERPSEKSAPGTRETETSKDNGAEVTI